MADPGTDGYARCFSIRIKSWSIFRGPSIKRLVVLGLVLATSWPVWSSEVELILRDAQTGFGLSGQVMYRPLAEPVAPLAGVVDELLADGEQVEVLAIERRGRFEVRTPLALRAEVPGYRPLRTVVRPDGRVGGRTLMLQPEQPLPMPESRAGHLRMVGWVHDADTLEPLAGAQVHVAGRDEVVRSDVDGGFALVVSAPEIVDDLPEPVTITVTAPGFPDWVHEGVLTGEDVIAMQVAMGGPSPSSAGHRQLQLDDVWPEAEPDPARRSLRPGGVGDEPPATITVGFADANCSQRCCTGGCPHACTFELEEYVRRGLPKEWIASWNHDALAAGAVAYRSYGAWHVFNPPSHGAYDLCSSACCQVNEPGTHGNTNAAVAATPGLMLIRNGQVFRSEYSAQNNCLLGDMSCINSDLSCGNGFVGSPLNNWPCLEDPVGLDRYCFGHGRGMSQWGNHYWTLEAEPRNWAWQLDHYYNAHGQGGGLRTATISQVMKIDQVRVQPIAAPGQAFVIELDISNLADEPHDAVLIGASIRPPGGPFIDDPDNDQPIALPPGPATRYRLFQLPEHAQPGDYEVWVALWIDVDGNGQITAADLSQHLVSIDAAIEVDGSIFFDRFEE